MGERTILLLAADPGGRAYLLEILKRYQITVTAIPEEAADLIRRHRYSLVIITNLGISPWLALDAVPAERDYPVLFLTGHIDPVIQSTCLAKRIAWLQVPNELQSLRRELRVALEDMNA